ncbi:MAG: hypothetical protein R3253_01405, partial [Longimicrobiales bacterium]|nr:hypothetical protein [Longimicrobiales bacterium]
MSVGTSRTAQVSQRSFWSVALPALVAGGVILPLLGAGGPSAESDRVLVVDSAVQARALAA